MIDEDFPSLSLGIIPSLILQRVNTNEEIMITFKIPNETNPDSIFYSSNFIYNS